mmetsp:Transcript_20539/g.60655  ORF Transcript_20539/g.60655 Transcript_20539/m.60655 type:complete len:576 (+) Transcript_20539:3-1730(+)
MREMRMLLCLGLAAVAGASALAGPGRPTTAFAEPRTPAVQRARSLRAMATASGAARKGKPADASDVAAWTTDDLKVENADAPAPMAITKGGLDPAGWFKAIATSAAPLPEGSEALGDLRRAGLDQLSAMADAGELPASKSEAWRQLGVRDLYKRPFATADATTAAAAAAAAAGLDASRVSPGAAAHAVFVDGVFHPELSDLSGLPEGAYVGGLAGLDATRREAVLARAATPPPGVNTLGLRDDDRHGALGGASFWALNEACAGDVACVLLGAGVKVPEDAPVHLTFIAGAGSPGAADAAGASHSRLVVDCDKGSGCTLVTAHVDAAGSEASAGALSNAVGQIYLAQNATVRHTIAVERGHASSHVESIEAACAEGAGYTYTTLQGPAALCRVNVGVDLLGRGAEGHARGLMLSGNTAEGPSALDLHTAVRHLTAGCTSSQLQKIIGAGRGRAVFRGLIRANGEAMETVAHQLCRSMLLNDGAKLDVSPCLEIIADDVQCTHGATVADLDEEKVFYFRARGISAERARFALVRGFADEVLADVPYEGAKLRLAEIAMGLIPEKTSKKIDTTGWTSI